ncbi:MAG: heavy-metal-associated domain-containing protein [Deltaproteobacteria bacterium]|nr:heavy-metal-associated domain-containing protein [Deltaproteobacteria bacterium]
MDKKTFNIPNISCVHCVNTIKNELEELDGVIKVDGNPEKKEINVEWDTPATIEKIKEILKEINYPSKD